MAGGDLKQKFGASNTSIACTFGNNPTGTINQHGRLSDAVDNTVTCYQEVKLGGKIKSGTTPSGNKQFVIYGLQSADGGSTYTDGYTVGDADSSTLVNTARPIGVIPAATSTTTYRFVFEVSLCFGAAMPDHWAIYVFNDHGVTPSTTNADHGFWFQGILSQYS